jgi:ferredoxin
MDVKKVGDMECVQCGECRKKCPENAISFRCGMATGKNGKGKNNSSA